MPRIHFVSGKFIDITEKEFKRIPLLLQQRGVRLHRTWKGDLIPLNSNTIELIQKETEATTEMEYQEKITKLKEQLRKAKEKVMEEVIVPRVEDKQINEATEPTIMEKAACQHPEDQKVLYVHKTKKGDRYFYVCGFCGKRERYCRSELLSNEEKLNAKIWSD